MGDPSPFTHFAVEIDNEYGNGIPGTLQTFPFHANLHDISAITAADGKTLQRRDYMAYSLLSGTDLAMTGQSPRFAKPRVRRNIPVLSFFFPNFNPFIYVPPVISPNLDVRQCEKIFLWRDDHGIADDTRRKNNRTLAVHYVVRKQTVPKTKTPVRSTPDQPRLSHTSLYISCRRSLLPAPPSSPALPRTHTRQHGVNNTRESLWRRLPLLVTRPTQFSIPTLAPYPPERRRLPP